MTHPITPPRELVEQWASEKCYDERDWLYELHIAARAAQWGADQELEACCEYVYERLKLTTAACIAQELRAARRPKQPNLKELALAELGNVYDKDKIDDTTYDTIRRALEQLDD
jgi:hypothetical protein